MNEVAKYKALGEMVQRSRVGGATFVALASYDELERRLAESVAAHEVAAQNHGALNTEIFNLQERLRDREDRYNREVLGLNNEGDPIGGEPVGGYKADLARLQQRADQLEALLLAATPSKVCKCRACGSTSLTWYSHQKSDSGVAEGRLRTHEVTCVFFLGCDECSETLAFASADQIAAYLPIAASKPAYDRRADLGCYFGLSHASWLTLPRALMEAMPDAWKKGIARLLHEYNETYTNQPNYGTSVRVTEGGKLVPTPDWLINYRHPNAEMINELRGVKPVEAHNNGK